MNKETLMKKILESKKKIKIEEKKIREMEIQLGKLINTEHHNELNESESSITFPKKRSKKNACFFCGSIFTHIAKHIKNKHSDEPEIQNILAIPITKSNLSQRRLLWEDIVSKGNFEYNVKLKESGDDKFIRKYQSDHCAKEVLPCIYCKNLYSKVKDHTKVCKKKPDFQIPGYIKSKSKQLWNSSKLRYDVYEDIIELVEIDLPNSIT